LDGRSFSSLLKTLLSKKSYDVLVVGSGPAGSTAAYLLAKHGMEVALLEKKPLPRHKTCGGGIVQRAFQFETSYPTP
jgi:flavin-dependent dehydrogenase